MNTNNTPVTAVPIPDSSMSANDESDSLSQNTSNSASRGQSFDMFSNSSDSESIITETIATSIQNDSPLVLYATSVALEHSNGISSSERNHRRRRRRSRHRRRSNESSNKEIRLPETVVEGEESLESTNRKHTRTPEEEEEHIRQKQERKEKRRKKREERKERARKKVRSTETAQEKRKRHESRKHHKKQSGPHDDISSESESELGDAVHNAGNGHDKPTCTTLCRLVCIYFCCNK